VYFVCWQKPGIGSVVFRTAERLPTPPDTPAALCNRSLNCVTAGGPRARRLLGVLFYGLDGTTSAPDEAKRMR
jgi:hypothetical protein